MKQDIDFNRALILMDVIVKAGQHGPLYQKLAAAAGDELKAMMNEPDNTGKPVTPPGGPANAAIGTTGGGFAQKPPLPKREPVVEPSLLNEEPTPVVERKV